MSKNTKRLAVSAMLIAVGTAISVICDLIPFLNPPFGGTVTIGSMVPVILISYIYGIKWGFGSAFIYALLQLFTAYSTVSALIMPSSDGYMGLGTGILVILIDYILAYLSLGLGGVFRNKMKERYAIVFGAVIATFCVFFFHVLSGALFYGEWAEWFFEESAFAEFSVSKSILEHFSGNSLAFIYSLIYNGIYMIPEIVINAILIVPAAKVVPLSRAKHI